MVSDTFLFTSESVSEGHPDKLCDQVSDAILDACLEQDENSRVACETATKTGMVIVMGEIKTRAIIDYQNVVRNVIKDIGYDSSEKGFDYKSCSVIVAMDKQSDEISEAVDHIYEPEQHLDMGAGDQGLMFGYATDETPEMMPLTAVLAHSIIKRLTECRKQNILPWLRPDAKSQVTIEYKYGHCKSSGEGPCIPLRVHTVVLSSQTVENMDLNYIRETLLNQVIKKVIPEKYLDNKTIFHIQPSGSFTIGGPMSDAGLTGRKIIVDTYGGWGAHGGGAFSGKDYSKVDRSAAYAARWVALSLVSNKLCQRCLVQLSYAIGISHPISLYVNTYGTGRISNKEILEIVKNNFDLRPSAIVDALSLKKPRYRQTSLYGHFKNGYPWEIPKKLDLKDYKILEN